MMSCLSFGCFVALAALLVVGNAECNSLDPNMYSRKLIRNCGKEPPKYQNLFRRSTRTRLFVDLVYDGEFVTATCKPSFAPTTSLPSVECRSGETTADVVVKYLNSLVGLCAKDPVSVGRGKSEGEHSTGMSVKACARFVQVAAVDKFESIFQTNLAMHVHKIKDTSKTKKQYTLKCDKEFHQVINKSIDTLECVDGQTSQGDVFDYLGRYVGYCERDSPYGRHDERYVNWTTTEEPNAMVVVGLSPIDRRTTKMEVFFPKSTDRNYVVKTSDKLGATTSEGGTGGNYVGVAKTYENYSMAKSIDGTGLLCGGKIMLFKKTTVKLNTVPAVPVKMCKIQYQIRKKDSDSIRFRKLNFMNDAREHFALSGLGSNRFIAAGGLGLKTAEVLEPGAWEWKRVASMRAEREKSVGVELNDEESMVCGPEVATNLTTCEVYNRLDDVWTSGPSFPPNLEKVKQFSMSTIGGRVFIVVGDSWIGEDVAGKVFLLHEDSQAGAGTTILPQAIKLQEVKYNVATVAVYIPSIPKP